MFESLRARWNAARRRSSQQRAAKRLRRSFSEVMGSDEDVLGDPYPIDRLSEKHFGRVA